MSLVFTNCVKAHLIKASLLCSSLNKGNQQVSFREGILIIDDAATKQVGFYSKQKSFFLVFTRGEKPAISECGFL